MGIFRRWALPVALAISHGSVGAETALQIADRLEAALRQKNTGAESPAPWPELARWHAQIHFITAGQDTRAAKKLLQALSATGLSKDAQTLGAAWAKQVEREQYDRQKALGNAIQLAVMKAAAACRDAREESDLDETLRGLGQLEVDLANDPSPQDMDPAFQAMLTTAARAVSAWQNFLALKKAGYKEQAQAAASPATDFVQGQQNFAGARNVEAILNADGSIDLTWENVSDNIREIHVAARPKTGAPVVIATLPADATSYHVPPPGTTESFPKGLDGPIIIETIPK